MVEILCHPRQGLSRSWTPGAGRLPSRGLIWWTDCSLKHARIAPVVRRQLRGCFLHGPLGGEALPFPCSPPHGQTGPWAGTLGVHQLDNPDGPGSGLSQAAGGLHLDGCDGLHQVWTCAAFPLAAGPWSVVGIRMLPREGEEAGRPPRLSLGRATGDYEWPPCYQGAAGVLPPWVPPWPQVPPTGTCPQRRGSLGDHRGDAVHHQQADVSSSLPRGDAGSTSADWGGLCPSSSSDVQQAEEVHANDGERDGTPWSGSPVCGQLDGAPCRRWPGPLCTEASGGPPNGRPLCRVAGAAIFAGQAAMCWPPHGPLPAQEGRIGNEWEGIPLPWCLAVGRSCCAAPELPRGGYPLGQDRVAGWDRSGAWCPWRSGAAWRPGHWAAAEGGGWTVQLGHFHGRVQLSLWWVSRWTRSVRGVGWWNRAGGAQLDEAGQEAALGPWGGGGPCSPMVPRLRLPARPSRTWARLHSDAAGRFLPEMPWACPQGFVPCLGWALPMASLTYIGLKRSAPATSSMCAVCWHHPFASAFVHGVCVWFHVPS